MLWLLYTVFFLNENILCQQFQNTSSIFVVCFDDLPNVEYNVFIGS